MYPTTFESDIATEGRNRLSVALRFLYVIPIAIVASLYGIGAYFASIIAWFSIVFTGRYPEGLYDFNGKALRILSRTNAYYYLATDEYPPFNGDDDPSFPIRVGIPEPLGAYDRLKTGLRLLLGIPVLLLAYVHSLIATVVSIIAWFAIVFTGKMPEGLVKPLHDANAYITKGTGYYSFLLTEDWPPFSDDEGSASAGQIEGRKPTKVG